MRPELAPLAPGSRIGLVAPAGPGIADRLERGMSLLTEWGFEPVVGEHVSAAHPRAAYLAGTDRDRADDLMRMWCDDTIDAVFCVRGGYGTVRVLDLLDADRLAMARPKPLFGSSDVTALHEYVGERLGLASWFTPMLATLDLLDDPAAIQSLRQAMVDPYPGREYRGEAARTIVPGTAHGVTSGGNLSLLVMTLGARTRHPVSIGPRIALLEDVTEDLYRIDGMMTQLLRSGWFDGVTGVALGSWRDCGDLEPIEALMAELLAPLGVPVVSELGFGHSRGAASIPLGVPATLDAGEECRLVLD